MNEIECVIQLFENFFLIIYYTEDIFYKLYKFFVP